ncbi:trypsin 5G1-like [Culicoides brevitarsis]|uniref:trypsin 5G1-like n=1 Tax=Culicoides brevitarsis TaxID=469753 RepID=UPI00307C262A
MIRAIIFTCLLVAVSAYWQPKEHRIVGGNEITIDKRPFQVSLNLNGYHYCGGSIINEYTILTAAHCSQNSASNYQIRAGSTQKGSGGQLIRVSQIIVHPKYGYNGFDSDVALMKLSEPLRFSADVQPIRMAPAGYIVNDGDTLVVSGWGALSSGGSSPNNLYEVAVPTVNQQVCANAYGSSSITNTMICAGVGGKDSCQGDSGGPLTHNDLHVGIVSWGRGCALAGYPGVYARTSELRDFIDQYA